MTELTSVSTRFPHGPVITEHSVPADGGIVDVYIQRGLYFYKFVFPLKSKSVERLGCIQL